jgi:hypothetical protein
LRKIAKKSSFDSSAAGNRFFQPGKNFLLTKERSEPEIEIPAGPARDLLKSPDR